MTGADMLFWAQASRRRDRGPSRRSARDARRGRRAARAARRARRRRARPWRSPWSSASCSIASASCCRSAISSPEGALDPNCYDLLASEARLASFFAIAKGDIPARHWFRLGRTVDAGRAWRGADLLVGLDVRVSDAVARHAGAGRQPARADQPPDRAPPDRLRRSTADVPWGISESAYNARDLEFTYQYSNFGVPGLGLKRGLGENLRHRALCDGAGDHGRSRARPCANLDAARRRSARAAATASTRRSTTRRRACPTAQTSPSCAPSWRITRA